MQIQLLYFAQLRERFERPGETVALPANVKTIADLISYLSARGGIWQEELTRPAALRLAMNQDMVDHDTILTEGAEVAIFRPVTGG